eukprot:scaffold214765_cov31-Tisochrysis_lutea.AAC.3
MPSRSDLALALAGCQSGALDTGGLVGRDLKVGVRRAARAGAPVGRVGEEFAHLAAGCVLAREQLLDLRQRPEVGLQGGLHSENGRSGGRRGELGLTLTGLLDALGLLRPAAENIPEGTARRVRLDGHRIGMRARDAIARAPDRRVHWKQLWDRKVEGGAHLRQVEEEGHVGKLLGAEREHAN